MPRVLFINRFYWPDVAASGQLLTELAEDLAARGWGVTVLTGRAGYGGGRSLAPGEEVRRGVRIVRVRGTSFGRGRTLGRAADYATFYLKAVLRLLFMSRRDVVVAMSDPPLLHVGCSLVGRLRRTPVVAWTQDVYPELALRFGVFRRRTLLYRFLDGLARLGHSLCSVVVAVGDRMADVMEGRGVPPGRLRCIPNWTDTRDIRPVPPEHNRLLQESGLSGRFLVVYSGNAGKAHTFEGVLEAAARVGDDDVVFVFAGGGAGMEELREAAEVAGLTNVRFRDYVERERLSESLSTASVSLVTQASAVRGLVVPSKLYPILASGRPVLFVGPEDSEVADAVREHRLGAVVAPGDVDAMVAWIRSMSEDEALRAALGRRARQVAEDHFDREAAVDRWERVLTGVTPEASAGRAQPCATPPFAGASYPVEKGSKPSATPPGMRKE